jgi:putative hemolysin
LDSPDPIWSQLLLQLILILLNAFFSSTEIAVISLDENRVRRSAESGDKKSGQLLRLIEKPANFLSTIQVGITLAGFLASAFAAERFAGRLAQWFISIGLNMSFDTLNTFSVILITIVLSYFMLVLGELLPKRIAMSNPDKVARFASGIIVGLAVLMRPVVWFLSKSTNGLLKLFGINPDDVGGEVTEEGIRLMVDIGEEKGAIETAEREMIENIFEFNNMNAVDAMTHRTDVTAIWVDEPIENIFKLIEESGLSRFPVYDEDIDDVIGILNARDFLLNERRDPPKELRDILRPAYFVPESVRTDVLFRDMQMKKVHLAVVVDEYGGTSGIVTMEDLLEEIVGNIYDEFDPNTEQDFVQLDDNLWRVAGSFELERLEEELGVDISDEDEYDTLGGLVFSQLNAIPEDGSHPEVKTCGLYIYVEELTDRRVEWARVSKLSPEEGEDADGADKPGKSKADKAREK